MNYTKYKYYTQDNEHSNFIIAFEDYLFNNDREYYRILILYNVIYVYMCNGDPYSRVYVCTLRYII